MKSTDKRPNRPENLDKRKSRPLARVMSLVISVLLLGSMLPVLPGVAVAATPPAATDNFQVGDAGYETLAEAVAALPASGGTIVMLKDTSLSSSVALDVNKSYTFDLGGNILSNVDTVASLNPLLTVSAGTMTIKNGTILNTKNNGVNINAGAVVTFDSLTIHADSAAGVTNRGNLTILSGEYFAKDDAIYSPGSGGGPVTIYAGHFQASGGSDGCIYGAATKVQLGFGSTADPSSTWLQKANEVTITAISSDENAALVSLGYSMAGADIQAVPNFSPTTMSYSVMLPFGTAADAVISLVPATMSATATVTINNGVTLAAGSGTATVTVAAANGATQDYTVAFAVLGDNFAVGSSRFGTLVEAVAALPDSGGTVTVLKDVALDSTLTLAAAKAYILDLNGKTIANASGKTVSPLLTVSAGDVTIKNGTITSSATDCVSITGTATKVTMDALTLHSDAAAGINLAGGSLYILSGDYSATDDAIRSMGTSGGSAVITAGHFSCPAPAGSDGCLYGPANKLSLAEGSVAVPENWRQNRDACDVTVTAGTLEPAGDKSALQAAVDEAAAKAEGDYTVASWAAFGTALTAAHAVLTSSTATQQAVDAATAALNDAISKLAVPGQAVSVTIRAQTDDSGFVVANHTMSVDPQLSERFGYNDQFAGAQVSALDALVAAHILVFGEADVKNQLAVSGGAVRKYFGEPTTSFFFLVNGQMPGDGNFQPDTFTGQGTTQGGYDVTQASLADGDQVSFQKILDSSMYMDYNTWFEQDGSKVAAISVEAGQDVTLGLRGYIAMYYGYSDAATQSSRTEGVADAQLAIVELDDSTGFPIGVFANIANKVTDDDGQVTLSFDTPGTYVVSAYDVGGYFPIFSPWLEVTVTAPNTPADKAALGSAVAAAEAAAAGKQASDYTADSWQAYQDALAAAKALAADPAASQEAVDAAVAALNAATDGLKAAEPEPKPPAPKDADKAALSNTVKA
ncbi:MAG: hypothetical protein FWF71_00030, partial [Actinomycetia bacterium]|nr:hypothetical protein [Actinomycetes bacterium]